MSDKNEMMEAIYNRLAEALLEKIQSGDATAQDLNVARQFLKDNNISGTSLFGSPIHKIAEALPFEDGDSTVSTNAVGQ